MSVIMYIHGGHLYWCLTPL